MVKAVIRGTGYPDSVPDTPEFRELYAQILQDATNMPAGVVPEIPWDYNDPPDPEPIAPAGPQIEQYATSGGGEDMDTILDQMGLSEAEGVVGQLIELARTPAWVNEKRDAHGQWTRGGGGTGPGRPRMAVAAGSVGVAQRRMLQQRVVQQRHEATAAVAERISQEHAQRALDEARAEVERVANQLKDEQRTAENAKHRAKLALHAVLILGGGILAAVLAHFDISPVLAGMASTLPLLATELTDWRKKLLWTPRRSRRTRQPPCSPRR